MIYMVTVIVINMVTREGELLTASERKSVMYKKRLFFANLCSILLAVYFFVRHNSYCEPGGNCFRFPNELLNPSANYKPSLFDSSVFTFRTERVRFRLQQHWLPHDGLLGLYQCQSVLWLEKWYPLFVGLGLLITHKRHVSTIYLSTILWVLEIAERQFAHHGWWKWCNALIGNKYVL